MPAQEVPDVQVLLLAENLQVLQEAQRREDLQDATQPQKAQLKARLQRAQQSVTIQDQLKVRGLLAKLQEAQNLQADLSEMRNLLAKIQEVESRSANHKEVRNLSTNSAKEKISVERGILRREEQRKALARKSLQARELTGW